MENQTCFEISDAVRQFYANLHVEPCMTPRCFTTFVYGYMIFVRNELLNFVLGLPDQGVALMDESEFQYYNFDPQIVMNCFTSSPLAFPRATRVSHLSNRLTVLYLYITPVLFPGSHSRHIVHPLGAWILQAPSPVDASTMSI
ncbi:hypothetical protein LINGRAHAP2_LOCUS34707 [Linum grandiflorum]